MAKTKTRRNFGNIRKLPSGRFQVSFVDPTGLRRKAPHTFESSAAGADWLLVQESQIVQRIWTDPDVGKIAFGPYAIRWIEERPGLRPRTVQLYEWTYKKHLAPTFADVFLSAINPAMVRRWRSDLLQSGVSASLTAKAYRLLRAILNTATNDDELIKRNPCRIQGAGDESPAERPIVTTAQVFALADAMPARLRCMVLLTTFASLRYGEVSAQRADIDFDTGTVRIRRTLSEVRGRGLEVGPPKSRAGIRTVSVPRLIMDDLLVHLAQFVGDEPEAFVFTGPKGVPIRRGNFNTLTKWTDLVKAVDADGLHFHDLRHTGNMLAAAAGGTTRDLMARMGHDSMNAALIYQHATAQADRHIAEELDARVRVVRNASTGS